MIDQQIIDRAVNIATRAAMRGNPLERIIWIPPRSASDSPIGAFTLVPCRQLSASDTPPWELS